MDFIKLSKQLKEIADQTNEQNRERIKKTPTEKLLVAFDDVSSKYLQANDSVFKECCLDVKNMIEEELKNRGAL